MGILTTWVWEWDFSAWGIKTGPFAASWANSCLFNFPTSLPLYWEANSDYPSGLIMRKGNSPNSQYGGDWGVSVPGAFKLDHLQPFKPILSWNFSNFFTFILGSQFLLPQRANNGKREILPTSNMDETEGFQCLGPSNWTTCSPLSQFHSEHFQTLSLSYWGPILITPEG